MSSSTSPEDDGEPFEQKMERGVEKVEIEKAIRANLASSVYGP